MKPWKLENKKNRNEKENSVNKTNAVILLDMGHMLRGEHVQEE
jgi:hypothetical protein